MTLRHFFRGEGSLLIQPEELFIVKVSFSSPYTPPLSHTSTSSEILIIRGCILSFRHFPHQIKILFKAAHDFLACYPTDQWFLSQDNDTSLVFVKHDLSGSGLLKKSYLVPF